MSMFDHESDDVFWARVKDLERRVAAHQKRFLREEATRGWHKMTPEARAKTNWRLYQHEFAKELADPAAFDKLPEACQRSIAQAKRGALGEHALRECERRALVEGPARTYATAVRR